MKNTWRGISLTLWNRGPALPLDRRQFLKLVGGGIVVFMTLRDAQAIQQEGRPGGRPQLPQDFNAFLRIGEDGRVSGFTRKIEMGQGVITSLRPNAG